MPPLLDTGGVCAFTAGDATEGVHHAFADDDDEVDDAEGVHHARALIRGLWEVQVPEDAGGVVHDLAVLTGSFFLDATRVTLDTALVRFFM